MISSISSNAVSAWSSALFSKLDTKNQGYIEQSDLQAAFDKADSAGSSGGATDVTSVFKEIDSDSDGKVTKDELTSALTKVAQQLDSQFNHSRVQRGMGRAEGGAGMPPPPPPGGASSAGSSDTAASSSSTSDSSDSNYIAAADTNGDGVVSAAEAAAYAQAGQAAQDTTSSASSTASGDLVGMLGALQAPPELHGANASGFSKDELSAQLNQIGSSDSKRSNLISGLIANFDKADTNGDGKISDDEAHAYDRSNGSGSAVGTSTVSSTASTSTDEATAMRQLLKLLQAYGNEQGSSTSQLSVLA